MAVSDVKDFYYSILEQYMAAKDDLADFEKGLADGFVTEDQVADLKDELANIEQNKERLEYIIYLLNMPNRSKKKPKYTLEQQKLLNRLNKHNNDGDAVLAENAQAIENLKNKISELKGKQQ